MQYCPQTNESQVLRSVERTQTFYLTILVLWPQDERLSCQIVDAKLMLLASGVECAQLWERRGGQETSGHLPMAAAVSVSP